MSDLHINYSQPECILTPPLLVVRPEPCHSLNYKVCPICCPVSPWFLCSSSFPATPTSLQKCGQDHVNPLLQTHYWVHISFGVQARVVTLSATWPHDLHNHCTSFPPYCSIIPSPKAHWLLGIFPNTKQIIISGPLPCPFAWNICP